MKKIGRALWEHEGIQARSTKKTGLAVDGDVCRLCPFIKMGCIFDGKECSEVIGKNNVFVTVEKTAPEPPSRVPVHTLKVKCASCGEMKVFSARTPSSRQTKELREAALNSKCWFCGRR